MSSIPEYVASHPPRCLANFALHSPRAVDGMSIEFRIAGQRDQSSGAVYGHSLQTLNPAYEGLLQFVSPLAVLWQGDQMGVPLLDTTTHGYHGEMGCSATLRGADAPSTYKCPHCGATLFRLTVMFRYWDAALDLWEDEPDLAIQDYFNGFSLDGECVNCEVTTVISSLEKL